VYAVDDKWWPVVTPVETIEEVTVTLRLEDKKEIVTAVNQVAAGAFSAVVADYRGLTVAQLTKLRVQARDKNVYVRVVRNTLARRAFDGTSFAVLSDSMVGPTIIGLALSADDMGAAARLFKDFSKDNQKLEVKALSIDGKLYGAKDIDLIAKLPNREQALTMLASVLQAPVSKFGRLLTALKEKNEPAAEPAPAEEPAVA
jgi:large subunit ribosomal protein L10